LGGLGTQCSLILLDSVEEPAMNITFLIRSKPKPITVISADGFITRHTSPDTHPLYYTGVLMRRRLLIDKKFQLKTTFRIIGIIIIAFIIIIAVTGIVSTDNNRKISAAITDLNRSIDKEKKTVEILFESAKEKRDPLAHQREGRLIDNHLETVTLMHTSIQLLKKTINQNLLLVTMMIVTSILLGVFLYFYLIRLTNRISGPIYVLTRHIHDILSGVEPDLRELRKNDELKEFYTQFVDFIKKQ
jgi:hypothetical protein